MIRMLVLAALLCPLAASAFDNEPTGFRGIEWDTAFEAVGPQFKLYRRDGGTVFYNRLDDKMSVGGAALRTIVYVFYRGHFQGVLLETAPDDVHSRSAMQEALEAQFGKPRQPNAYIQKFYWFGPLTAISLDCSAQNLCRTVIRSKVVGDREFADRKAAATAAKKDF